MSTQDNSSLWIYVYSCVIFKQNYWLLLQLSDSHAVPSISNNYLNVRTGVQVYLPHVFIVSVPVHALLIKTGSYKMFVPHTIKVARLQMLSHNLHLLDIVELDQG